MMKMSVGRSELAWHLELIYHVLSGMHPSLTLAHSHIHVLLLSRSYTFTNSIVNGSYNISKPTKTEIRESRLKNIFAFYETVLQIKLKSHTH